MVLVTDSGCKILLHLKMYIHNPELYIKYLSPSLKILLRLIKGIDIKQVCVRNFLKKAES